MSELSTYISVDTDDLDETPVTLGELPSFVRVYFGDNSDGRHVPNDKEADQMGLTPYRKLDVLTGRETIYIEDAFTGEFIPITVAAKKFDDSLTDDSAGGDDNIDGSNENGEDAAISAIVDPFADESTDLNHVQYITFLKILFLFVQGILAGFSFVTVYVEVTGGTDIIILEDYQVSANEYRRFFYVLTTFAVVGSLDLFMSLPKREVAKKKSKLAAKKADESSSKENIAFVSFVAVLSYSLCFLCSLVMGVTDTLVYYEGGVSVDSTGAWAEEALKDEYFSGSYDNWRVLGYVRFASAFVGFVA